MLPHVHILMCTKDGGAFLSAQLQSILTQTHKDWSLWISDDGSTDQTVPEIERFIAAHPRRDIRLLQGPRKGCAQNFMSLLAHPGLDGAWVAFADQDDIWMPHKLGRAVDMIWRGTGAQIYASRSVYTDSQLNVIGMSPRYQRPFEFGNALVQNVLNGNTIVIPPRITDFLRSTVGFSVQANVPFHDWWVYQMVTGAGFDVIHDAKPGVFYRQHENNILGARRINVLHRAMLLLRRIYVEWVDRNVAMLNELAPVLNRSSRRLLFDFVDWRSQATPILRAPPQSIGVYRQSASGDLALRAMGWMGGL
ncbi:glycosyltransferase family 2 protein [Roseobacter sp. GAI101]|uniref:glycosyltransferase family 2 protein n=1 Tax=Roseobacter sp. (strain GAI101) TaxID=391589 RepID=UPI0001872114|nr:glycosyltransferase family 2 protein [Roseobacter sp. GAI101]EEB83537.1 glycosyl transferase, group 2 family [Roseobacter sp. GAI101]